MIENAQHYIRALTEPRDPKAPYQDVLQPLYAERRFDLLIEIAAELSRLSDPDPLKPWRLRSIFDGIPQNIALISGSASAGAIVSIADLTPPYRPDWARQGSREQSRYASLLAGGQDVDVLMPLFVRHGDDGRSLELLACLAQEMALRGIDAENTPLALFWEQKIVSSGHPLSHLPLSLFIFERGFGTLWQRYANCGCAGVIPFGSVDDLGPRRDVSDEPPSWQCKDVTPPDTALIETVVTNWRRESNGRTEVRVFELSQQADPESVNRYALRSLGLQCLEGTDMDRARINTDYLKDALESLFSAAANGGAHGRGVYGAYGRRDTWRSVAGLLGCGEEVPIADLASQARQCTWYCFSADAPWFYQVAWDFRIAVLSNNGRRLAVLAATDTD